MKHLCDSNIFIALALEAHPHHSSAVSWLENLSDNDTLHFCRATQLSFLRLLTVKEVMKDHVCTNERAIKHFETLLTDARISLLETEPVGLQSQWLKFARHKDPSPKKWMDAYLAAFAASSNMRFVTFDKGFINFSGLDILLLE